MHGRLAGEFLIADRRDRDVDGAIFLQPARRRVIRRVWAGKADLQEEGGIRSAFLQPPVGGVANEGVGVQLFIQLPCEATQCACETGGVVLRAGVARRFYLAVRFNRFVPFVVKRALVLI